MPAKSGGRARPPKARTSGQSASAADQKSLHGETDKTADLARGTNLARRLRRKLPRAQILLGLLWTLNEADSERREALKEIGVDLVVTWRSGTSRSGASSRS
jgi:hypothetical protein